MLTEKRQEEILHLIEIQGSVTVQELTERLDASESTIRRDLAALDKKGLAVKVFGGAVQKEQSISVKEEKVALRLDKNKHEKILIAEYAASLIEPNDFIYLDAGTTTSYMIPFIKEETATFVTNAVSHALSLSERGFRVILIGGELKMNTEAIVGNEAYVQLQKYNFTKGFWGANGVSRQNGFTTPEINEALTKECAMKHTQKCYVLCDSKKFYQTGPITFARFEDANIITDKIPDESYVGLENMVEVKKLR